MDGPNINNPPQKYPILTRNILLPQSPVHKYPLNCPVFQKPGEFKVNFLWNVNGLRNGPRGGFRTLDLRAQKMWRPRKMILSRFQKKNFKNISISHKAENEKEKIEMKREKTIGED